ncbi:MAG: acetylglutamate kinase [Chloroflexota bacterium]|nr:MAG: acetylglutamate kinase [Chloroflexota bacterium]
MTDAAPVVVKIGGNEIDDPAFLAGLAPALRALDVPVVVVHGGGKEISALQQALGIEPRYLDGVRVTDAASLTAVEMVLCGAVSTRLVRHLVAGGVDALGVSGVDRGLIRAEKMPHPTVDMGFTGAVTAVRAEALRAWLAQGVTPVIAPICLGPDSAYNVNADHVAGAVAAALGAREVVFLTNVEGVMLDGKVIAALDAARARELIADGTIFGGMIPKVQTALHALEGGVPQAVITNLAGLQRRSGTVFTQAALTTGEGS